jgi:hypothetical protein
MLPSILRELHMTAGQLEWVISAYALSLAALSVPRVSPFSRCCRTPPPFAVAFEGYVLVGVGWGTLVPGVGNVAMRDVPLGVAGGASGLVNAARQVGTSVGLAVLGTIGVHAATSVWANRSAGVPGGRRTGSVRGGFRSPL